MQNPTILKITVATVVALGLAAAPAASDDNDNGWFGGWGMSHMGHGWSMMHGWGRGPGSIMGFGENSMLDRIDGRLAFLKTELKITESQQKQWEELASTIRTNAEVHNAMMRDRMEEMRSGKFFEKPLPDRLAIQEAHLESRLQQVKDVRAALDKLYAVLDDNQKKTADEIVLPMMGLGMGMMGRGMRGMMRDN